MRNRIDRDTFGDWFSTKTIEYASETITVTKGGVKRRVVFETNLRGGYFVTVGGKRVYAGIDFDDAAEAYNKADQ